MGARFLESCICQDEGPYQYYSSCGATTPDCKQPACTQAPQRCISATNLIQSDSFQPRRARTPQPSQLLHDPHPPSPDMPITPRPCPGRQHAFGPCPWRFDNSAQNPVDLKSLVSRGPCKIYPTINLVEEGAIHILLPELRVLSEAGPSAKGPLPASSPRRSKSAGSRQAIVTRVICGRTCGGGEGPGSAGDAGRGACRAPSAVGRVQGSVP
jgi:hypothetical protein